MPPQRCPDPPAGKAEPRMRSILFEWHLHPTTWVYLSSLMTIGIYFKFNRLWSVRNLDLLGLIALAPGLLLIEHRQYQLGFSWLFAVGGFFVIRLLLDTVMVRRPLLEPNLSASGLTFTLVCLLVFLMGNVIAYQPTEDDLAGARRLERLLAREEPPVGQEDLLQHGPGYPLFFVFASFANRAFMSLEAADAEQASRAALEDATAKVTAILGHLALIAGMVLIGYKHFDNLQTGFAASALYLLLPYTAQMTGRVDHVLPAALLVWAVAAYRRPIVAGVLLGLSAGAIYYPLFLLPLWCGFYWRRGFLRFCLGTATALVVLVATLTLTASTVESFVAQLRQMFGFLNPLEANLVGFWQYHEPAFRLPVVAAFVAMCLSMALWPAQKNLGTLLSCSAAVMLGVQFWHGRYGGIYMAWYLPLLVLTIFRPNLEDRVAYTAVFDFPIRRWRWWTKKSNN